MEGRYDVHLDTMTQNEYCDWCIDLFNQFDKVLNENGVILWNVSYGSDGTVNTESIGLIWLAIADIIRNTSFTVADRIIWKKNSALPNLEQLGFKPREGYKEIEQGFIDHHNNFLTREEAYEHAKMCGQFCGKIIYERESSFGKKLISEDLW